MSATHLYLVGLGSNRPHGRHGRPQGVIEAAIARLDAEFTLFDASPILLNPAFGDAGRDFANGAVMLETALEPAAMLSALKAIERAFGRRPGMRWGPRVLDLDILAWSGGKYARRGLTIPHKALAERASALVPAAAIAPNWTMPGSALALRHLKERLGKRAPRR